MNTESAIQYLSKDPLLHTDMLESIRSGHAELLAAGQDGVLLINTAAEAVMMSTESAETADRMLACVPAVPLFVAHQSFYEKAAAQKFGYTQKMVCHQAIYLKGQPLPIPCGAPAIRPLNRQHLSFIMEHYTHADDEAYLMERLESGAMFGAFTKDVLAGFIGTHAEGSMGMLEVLPPYRRRGIALALETFLINRLLDRGRVPFAQIVTDNAASLKLQRKLGFTVSDKTLSWLMM
jgi:tRNA (guanine37-N1)-methyltransferase